MTNRTHTKKKKKIQKHFNQIIALNKTKITSDFEELILNIISYSVFFMLCFRNHLLINLSVNVRDNLKFLHNNQVILYQKI